MLVEVLIGALLMSIGVMALIGTFDTSRSLVSTSERNQVASHQAEAAMESVLALPFTNVALTSTPTHSTDPSNPDYYVTNGLPPRYQWDQGSTGPQSDPLVADALNGKLAHVSSWTDGQSRLSGSIYRYVTQVTDSCCPGSNFARRVTIAVTVNGTGLAKPVLMSSIVVDPTSG